VNRRIPLLFAVLVWAAATVALAAEATGANRQKAVALFQKYVQLEHDFDPKLADLYSDSARIEMKLVYQKGSQETKVFPAPERKRMLRMVMPLAKKHGDLNFYTEETYTQEGPYVRIRAKRYAQLDKFTSPVELLVGPGPDGNWLIFEEKGENHPPPAAAPK
jgi:hypothetical protein